MPHHDRDLTLPYLPMLGRHAHLDPSDGACLMEYVAVLAGEPFSDSPGCTHPVLAAIARLVNDAASDPGRRRLAVLAPDLASAGTGDPVQGLLADPDLVAAALDVAARHTGNPRLVRLTRRVRHRSRHLSRRRPTGAAPRQPAGAPLTPWRRLTAVAWRRGPAMHALGYAVNVVRRLPDPGRDTVLRAMLTAALDTWYARPATATNQSQAQTRGRTATAGARDRPG